MADMSIPFFLAERQYCEVHFTTIWMSLQKIYASDHKFLKFSILLIFTLSFELIYRFPLPQRYRNPVQNEEICDLVNDFHYFQKVWYFSFLTPCVALPYDNLQLKCNNLKSRWKSIFSEN